MCWQSGRQLGIVEEQKVQVSIVIFARDRPRELSHALAGLRSLNANTEILIADEGAGANLTGVIESARLIQDPLLIWQKKQPFASAHLLNRAVEMSSGELILFQCENVVAGPNLLDHHQSALQKDSDAAVGPLRDVSFDIWSRVGTTGQNILKINASAQAAAWFDVKKRSEKALDEVSMLSNVSINRHVFESMKGFDEQYSTFEFAALDFRYQLEEKGVKVKPLPLADALLLKSPCQILESPYQPDYVCALVKDAGRLVEKFSDQTRIAADAKRAICSAIVSYNDLLELPRPLDELAEKLFQTSFGNSDGEPINCLDPVPPHFSLLQPYEIVEEALL